MQFLILVNLIRNGDVIFEAEESIAYLSFVKSWHQLHNEVLIIKDWFDKIRNFEFLLMIENSLDFSYQIWCHWLNVHVFEEFV